MFSDVNEKRFDGVFGRMLINVDAGTVIVGGR